MQSHLYIFEKLFDAVNSLATEQGSLRDRLYSAYTYSLSHIQEKNLPSSIGEEIRTELQENLSRIRQSLREDGNIAITTKTLKNDDAQKMAEKIVSMCRRLAHHLASKD